MRAATCSVARISRVHVKRIVATNARQNLDRAMNRVSSVNFASLVAAAMLVSCSAPAPGDQSQSPTDDAGSSTGNKTSSGSSGSSGGSATSSGGVGSSGGAAPVDGGLTVAGDADPGSDPEI